MFRLILVDYFFNLGRLTCTLITMFVNLHHKLDDLYLVYYVYALCLETHIFDFWFKFFDLC